MGLITFINFPLGQRLKPDYPFNNLMGKICSGNGVHKSNISPKDESLHLMLPATLLIYIFFTWYLNRKTERYMTSISPKGSGALLNKQHRYFLLLNTHNFSTSYFSTGGTFLALITLATWWSFCQSAVLSGGVSATCFSSPTG